MKVVCIKNNKYDLTINKTYEVIRLDFIGDYIIIDDNCKKNWYPKSIFKTISKIRNEKIDRLLN